MVKIEMLLNLIIHIFYRKEAGEMAVVYATLIIKGKKTFSDVPATIQAQVREVLIDLDCADLVQ